MRRPHFSPPPPSTSSRAFVFWSLGLGASLIPGKHCPLNSKLRPLGKGSGAFVPSLLLCSTRYPASSSAWGADKKPSFEKRGKLVTASHPSLVLCCPPRPWHPTSPSLDKALGETLHQAVFRSFGKCPEVSGVQLGFDSSRLCPGPSYLQSQ